MFNQALQALLDSLRNDGIVPARHLLVGEVGPHSHDLRGYPKFRTRDLVAGEDYGPRFATLIDEGYPWMNISYYGTVRGWGLLVVELPAPERKSERLRGKTIVNWSGPSKRVIEHGGDTEPFVVFDEALPACAE